MVIRTRQRIRRPLPAHLRRPTSAVTPSPTTTVRAADLLGAPQGWEERALCAQVDTELFFPEKGGSVRGAKRICSLCEVTAQCRQYALDENIDFGVWGGLSARERHRLKRGTS